MKGDNKHILTPGWVGVGKDYSQEYLEMVGGDKFKSKPTFDFDGNGAGKKKIFAHHYWISNKHGYAMTSDKTPPGKRKGHKYKYMGFSHDDGWPKKMSTGRVIYPYTLKKKKDSLAGNSKQLNRNDNQRQVN